MIYYDLNSSIRNLAGLRPAGSHCENSGSGGDSRASIRSGCAKRRSAGERGGRSRTLPSRRSRSCAILCAATVQSFVIVLRGARRTPAHFRLAVFGAPFRRKELRCPFRKAVACCGQNPYLLRYCVAVIFSRCRKKAENWLTFSNPSSAAISETVRSVVVSSSRALLWRSCNWYCAGAMPT